MQRVPRHLTGVVCLLVVIICWSVEAYAQTTGGGSSSGALGRIETKVQDIVTLVQNVLTALTVVAVGFVGFKFIKGDPDAWSFALKALVGVVVIFGAASLVQWLST